MHSVEQSQDFHVTRRIAALVAPGWRLFATAGLENGAVAVDLSRRTIEIGEGTGQKELVAAAMFSLGYVRQQKSARFAELFGHGLKNWKGTSTDLTRLLAQQGALADRYAFAWAIRAVDAFWPGSDFCSALSNFTRSRAEWERYFSTV